MAKFQVGESVVCIDDDFSGTIKKSNYWALNITWPVRGKCYVVRGYAKSGGC